MSEIIELPIVGATLTADETINLTTDPAAISWKVYKDEFVHAVSDGNMGELGLQNIIAGGTSQEALAVSGQGGLGIYQLGSGSSGTGYASLSGSTGTAILGDAAIRIGMYLKFDQVVDATDDWHFLMGFNDLINAINNNHIAILVDRDHYTTNFTASTESGGTQTVADTGVAMDLLWHWFEIDINAAGTSVGFYIDGVLTNTITTNLPTVSMQHVVFQRQITGAARTLKIDYWYIAFRPTAVRGTNLTWIGG